MLLTNKALKQNAFKRQYDEIEYFRQEANKANERLVNAGIVPRDVYQDMQRETVEVMRSDDGDAFLNDLMPEAKGINIGKQTSVWRKASDAGSVTTSFTAQTGTIFDQVEYNYDGTIVPCQTAGFYVDWREYEAQRSEGFDSLIDNNREVNKEVKIALADSFLDGWTDKNGQYLNKDGYSWTGMRNDTSRVAQVDLGAGGLNFDFTDQNATYEQIEAAFKQVRDILWIQNNCERDVNWYISREIASNFERKSSEGYDSRKIIERLESLMGVSSIKPSNKLVGNEMMAFGLGTGMVRPLSGMMISTVALPRVKFNDNYEFMVWHATGWQVTTDYKNQKCALFAAG